MRVGELQIFIGLLLHSRAQVKTHLLRSVTLLALLISFPFDSLNAEDGDLTLELVSFGPVQETKISGLYGKETRLPGPRKWLAVILKITPNKARALLDLSRSKVRGQLSTGAEADYVGFTPVGTIVAKDWLTPNVAELFIFNFDKTQINWPDTEETKPTDWVAIDLSGTNKNDRFVYEFSETNRSSTWALFFDALPTQLAVIYCNGTSIKLAAN